MLIVLAYYSLKNGFNRDHEHQPSSFLVIQTSVDRPLQTSPGTVIVNPLPTSPSVTGIASQTGRGASVVRYC